MARQLLVAQFKSCRHTGQRILVNTCSSSLSTIFTMMDVPSLTVMRVWLWSVLAESMHAS